VNDGRPVRDTASRGGVDADDAAPTGEFRRTLVRVLAMQVISLALLWLLQTWFGR
jgi:hypothetical protein